MPPARTLLAKLILLALALGVAVGCSVFQVTTSTCTTCFADGGRCEKWSGNEETNRRITARKLCEGDVPAAHAKACKSVMEFDAKEPAGAPDLPKSHFTVTCTETSRARTGSCGGFN